MLLSLSHVAFAEPCCIEINLYIYFDLLLAGYVGRGSYPVSAESACQSRHDLLKGVL